jgi:hypothetical protein
MLVGCSGKASSLEDASDKYKKDKTYASLKIVYDKLSKGMPRKEVDSLLGDPDYSPIDGQYYYSSDKRIYDEDQDREVPVGVVVDYRNDKDEVTEILQEFSLGPIGE